MPAIKAVNSRGLKIINCKFSGFETDIELDNVEDFVSENNQFSGQNDPRVMLCELLKIIDQGNIPLREKERISHGAIDILSKGKFASESEKEDIKRTIGRYVGDKAVDYFVQLAAAVSAGLILRS
jgi:hypothetical protein